MSNHIDKPKTAYAYFTYEFRQQLKRENKKHSFGEIMTFCGQQWKVCASIFIITNTINLNQNTTWPSAMLDFHVPVLYIVDFILDPLIVQPYN
jgi:hypothetical protein